MLMTSKLPNVFVRVLLGTTGAGTKKVCGGWKYMGENVQTWCWLEICHTIRQLEGTGD